MIPLTLGGCSGDTGAVGGDAGLPGLASSSSNSDNVPSFTVTPADGATDVRLDSKVKITVSSGAIEDVNLHSDADPTPLAGTFSDDRRSWSTTAVLDPGSHYRLNATAHSATGTSTMSAAFSTLTVIGRLTTDVFPSDGSTVGVGLPVVLKFSAPVARNRQARVLEHIHIQTSVPIAGAWHWFGASEVHWRPRDYWPTGTRVTVRAELRGIEIGDGVWGLGTWTSSFTIGPKHTSIIDAATHQMQVFDGDQLIRTYPVSTGKDASPTISGTLFVWYKVPKVRMVSTSIGIPVNAPGGYDEQVFWDTAISTDGFYIHAAPWSVGSQGFANVSHGCVNLSTSRATEFFNFSQVGDVVQVKNTTRVADYFDGEADWQIPFEQYANTGGAVQAPPTAQPGTGGGL